MSTNVNDVAAQLAKGGINSLTVEQKEFYEAHKAEVEAAKRNDELQKGLAGNSPDDPPTGLDFYAKTLKPVEVTAEKPKQSWWDKNKGIVTGIGSAASTVAGLICLATGVGAGVGIGLLAVGGAGLFASCVKQDQFAYVSTNAGLEELLNTANNIVTNQQEQTELLNKILQLLNKFMSQSHTDNLALQEKIEAQSRILATILNCLTDLSGDLANYFTQLLGKMDQMEARTLNKLDEIIKNQKLDREQDAKFMRDILEILNRIEGNQAAMYVDFMAQLDQIIHNQRIGQEQREHLEALGVAILNKIPEGADAGDYGTILQEIANRLASIQEGMTVDLQTIIDNQGTINANMLAGIQALMDNNDSNTAAIIAAMEANKAALALEIQGLGVKLDGISQTVTTDLTQIIANQGTMISNQQTIKNVLVNDIKPIVQAIKVKVESMSDQAILAKLQAIYDKIPDGCHCQTLDLTSIIEKLDTIINNLNNGNGSTGSNEGLIDDLDDELA